MSDQDVQYRPDLLVLKNGITVVKNSFISESLLTLCLTIFCNFFLKLVLKSWQKAFITLGPTMSHGCKMLSKKGLPLT